MSQTPNPSQRPSTPKKIGIGLAVVALPVAAAIGVWELKQAEDAHNEDLERGFTYDDAKLRVVDPALIGWREVGQIATHMDKPTCIAVSPSGQVLIGGTASVSTLDEKGNAGQSFSIPAPATAIAGDSEGRIYVAMNNRVVVYSTDGKFLAWPSLGDSSHVTSIAVGTDRVYVADSGKKVGRALIFDLEGRPLGELGAANSTPGAKGIITPSPHMDVALTADGNAWVANPGRHQLELYSPAGELLRSFGESGTGIEQFLGCCNPSDFSLLSDGRIVTAEKGVPRIKVFQDDGHLANVVVPPSAFGGNRAGIDVAADSHGRVLVLEPGTRTIRLFAEGKS